MNDVMMVGVGVGVIMEAKLNPLRAMWSMEWALISGFCSVKQMRVFDSP